MKKLLFILFSLLAIGAGYFYMTQQQQEQQVHYLTEPVKRGNLAKNVLASGSIRAIQRTEVGAQVSGKVQKLHVQLGQAVKKGELIAEIDSETQQNNLNTAQAQLLSYKAQQNARQVSLNIAESNYRRLEKLYAQKSVSLNDLDSAKNTLASAKASLEESNSQIQVAEIAVNTAKTNLAYTQILSPMDGIVVSIPVSVGQTVNANQTSPTIVQIADLAKILIKLEIAEGDIALIKTGLAVSFNTLAEPNRFYHGTIASIDPALTTLTDNNYTEQSGNSSAVYYYANVILDNQDQSLRIGMTAQGKIIIAEKAQVLLVPTSAIKKQGKQHIVTVLAQGKAVEKVVELGLSDSLHTEILTGLNENEQVITAQRAADEKVGSPRVGMRF